MTTPRCECLAALDDAVVELIDAARKEGTVQLRYMEMLEAIRDVTISAHNRALAHKEPAGYVGRGFRCPDCRCEEGALHEPWCPRLKEPAAASAEIVNVAGVLGTDQPNVKLPAGAVAPELHQFLVGLAYAKQNFGTYLLSYSGCVAILDHIANQAAEIERLRK